MQRACRLTPAPSVCKDVCHHMRNVPLLCVAVQTWPNARDVIVIAIESVQLWRHLAQPGSSGQVFVMFSFLPDLCKAQQQQTPSLPVSRDPINFEFSLVSCACMHVVAVCPCQ